MNLSYLVNDIRRDLDLSLFLDSLKAGFTKKSLKVAPALKPIILSAIFKSQNKSILVITSHVEAAEALAADISNFIGDKVAYLPDRGVLSDEDVKPDKRTVGRRLRVLNSICSSQPTLVVAALKTTFESLASKDDKAFLPVTMSVGQSIDFDGVLQELVDFGYKRVYMVEQTGEFSIRGGIIDIFPVTEDQPVRIELSGDKVESIRRFSLVTQRSINSVKTVEVYRAEEPDYANSSSHNLLDYLDKGIVVLDQSELWPSEYGERKTAIDLPVLDLSISEESEMKLDIQKHPFFAKAGKLVDFDLLKKHLKKLIGDQYEVAIVVEGKGQAERFIEMMNEWQITSSQIKVISGRLQEGFVYPEARMAILTDSTVFGHHREHRPLKQTKTRSFFDLMDVKKGDHVVHIYHGIGIYDGLGEKEVDGVKREYMIVKYAEKDRLYVPVDQMSLIQKYVGGEGVKPSVYRLGGRRWQRVKRKVRQSAEELADELVKLYAERQKIKGHAFASDTPWQKELEESFSFVETPDQTTAILSVKEDMEQTVPMDRLICGDVGYGKTEVAIRAAFKAIMDDKQVAILVPTTILADQHAMTFKERFQAFPIRTEVLSRLKTAKEQEETLADLRLGTVDVVIGTHRLLQKDINFKDLGLVVVDEEQRFGVRHKEHLKELRRNVDVLSLSATPIPRTLNMSLTGVRDMSVIDTPPEDRYPVSTYVGEYSDSIIESAVKRELERDGQVFYVHNRIGSIDMVAKHLKQLIPEARIAVAHGRMGEKVLKNVMHGFYDRNYDILVSTTIIESGLDVPNVNTLIVDRSDRLGLSQLYQLRGRVGRADRRSFAYFFFPVDTSLKDMAQSRLRTIAEFTELGSGFRIALRDLQIRGAGNLLGSQQHGFINDVGFELYAELLREAVAKLKGRPVKRRIETRINLPIEGYIPEDYIKTESLRIDTYRKIALAARQQQLNDLSDELVDRFGPVPSTVQGLLAIAGTKLLAERAGIRRISMEMGRIRLYPVELSKDQLRQVREVESSIKYKPNNHVLYIPFPGKKQVISLLRQMLYAIID